MNEFAARSLFPGGEVVGKTITSYGKSYTIVGVIADLKMPGLDGLSVIREAKRYKADLPVIITLWHGQHFLGPFMRRPEHRAKALISWHRDADINAMITRGFLDRLRRDDPVAVEQAIGTVLERL